MPLHGRASQFHRSQPLRARSRAGKALFRRATPLFRRAPRRPWPPERPSHPPEATGGSERLRKILMMPRTGGEPVPPCPALAGTVTSGQSPIPSGNAPTPSCTPPPLASGEAEPPSGGHRRPPGGLESLRKILTMPPHRRRANSTVPPPCPALAGTVASGQSPIPSGNAPIALTMLMISHYWLIENQSLLTNE